MANGNENGRGSLELDFKNRRALLSGPNVIALITLVGVIGMFAFTVFHYEDTRDRRREIINAMEELTQVVREANQVTRELNCLVSIPVEDRARWTDWCKKSSGGR